MTDKYTDDRRTDDRCTDGRAHRKIMLLLHTLTIRESDIAGLVENRPVV